MQCLVGISLLYLQGITFIKEYERGYDMKEKYLPLGTVVLLNGGTKRLMITGYCMKIKEKPGVVYDYSGCLYPEGTIKSDITSVFNHNQIQRIDFMGFSDVESKEFMTKLKAKEQADKNKKAEAKEPVIEIERL